MMRHLFRRARGALLGGAAAAALTLTPVPAHAFLDTEKAWNDLLQFAVRQVNAPGEFEIELGQVTRPEDGFARIESLRLRDSDGVWLEASNLLVDWQPTSLLRGRFEFETLSADEIRVLRAPISRGDPPAEEAGIDFAWPRPPVSLSIDALEIDRLSIEGGLLPQDLAARIEGSFTDRGDVQDAQLQVARIDRPGDRIGLKSRIDFDSLDIAFSLKAEEQPGGLVAQMAALPADQALELSLDAEGDPGNLPFSLYADIGQIGIAEGKGTARWDGGIAAKFDGAVRPGAETAPAWRRALGKAATIALDVEETEPGAYRLGALKIGSNAFALDGAGTVDTGGNTIDLALDWAAQDIDALNAVIAPAKLSALTGMVRATGALTAPKLDVDARADNLVTASAKADSLRLIVESAPETGEGAASGTQGFSLDARASGLDLSDAQLQAALGTEPRLTGEGAFLGSQNRVVLDQLKLVAETLDLTGDATYDIGAGALGAALSGSASRLGPFFRAAGLDVDGAATLALKIESLTSQSVERLFLNAQMRDLSSGDPTIAAVLGEEAALDLLLAESNPGRVRIERASLESNALAVGAKGDFSIPEDDVNLALDWTVKAPDALSALIDPAEIGGASGTANVAGTISEPALELAADASDLAFDDYAARSAKIRVSGQMRKDRRIPFDIEADLDGVATGDPALEALLGAAPRIAADGLYDTATGLLSLGGSQLDLADADAAVSGDIQIRKRTLDIAYDLKAGDISGLSELLGETVSGSADLAGRLEGPFSLPFVTAKGEARDLRYGAYGVDLLDLDIETEPEGENGAPFRIDVAASGPRTGDPALDALLGETPSIAAKGMFAREGPRISLDYLDAKLAEARAAASGFVDLGEERLGLDFDLDAKSLDGLEAVLGKPVAGALTAKGRAAGRFGAPEIDAEIDGRGLRYDDYRAKRIAGTVDIASAGSGTAPFDIDMEAEGVSIGDERLDPLLAGTSSLKAKGGFDAAAQRVSLRSGTARVAGAALSLSGDVDLGKETLDIAFDLDAPSLAPFSDLAGNDLAGEMKASGTARGSFSRPQLDIELDGSDLGYAPYSIGALSGRVETGIAQNGAVPFSANVSADAVSTGDPKLDVLLREASRVRARGSFDPDAQILRVAEAEARVAGADASLSGRIDLGAQTLDIAFDLAAAEIAPFGAFADADLEGALSASGTVEGGFSTPLIDARLSGRRLRYEGYTVAELDGRIDAAQKTAGYSPFDIDLTARGIGTGDPALDTALGPQVALAASGGFDRSAQRIRLDTADLRTDAATATAEGEIDLAAQTLDLRLDAEAKGLEGFSALAGKPLGGSANLAGRVSGSFADPSIGATIDGSALRYDTYSIGRVAGSVVIPSGAGGPAPFRVDATASAISTGDPKLDDLLRGDVTVDARGTLDRSAQRVRLDAARVETGFLTATAQGDVDLAAQTLDLTFDANAAELAPFSGVAGNALGGSLTAAGRVGGSFGDPALDVSLAGQGLLYAPYSIGRIDGTVAIPSGAGGPAPFRVDATASAISTGDPKLDDLLRGDVTVDARGTLDRAAQRVRLDAARVETGFLTATAQGDVDLAAQTLDLTFDASAAELAPFSGVAGNALGGSLTAAGRVGGSFGDPALDVSLAGQGLLYAPYSIGRIDGTVAIPSGAGGPAPFRVDATASAISTGDPKLDDLLRGDVTVDARGTLDRSAQRVRLDAARVETGFLTATAQGDVDLAAQTLDLTFDANAAELAPFSGVAGNALGGSLNVSGSARGPFSIPAVSATARGSGIYYDRYSLGALDLSLDMPQSGGGVLPFTLAASAYRPRLGDAALESLLGETVTLNASGSFDPAAKLLLLDRSEVTLALGRASAQGRLDLAAQMLDLGYSADIGDLGTLSGLAGKPLAGSVTASGQLSGAFADPSITGRLSGSGLLYDNYRVNALNADYALRTLVSGPAGSLDLNGETDFGPITASTRFDLGGGMQRIESFSVNGLGLDTQGALSALPGGVFEGSARLSAFELAQLGGFLGLDLAGTATGTVSLSAPGGQQSAVFDLSGTGLRYAKDGEPLVALGRFNLAGRADDALGRDPYLDVTVGGGDGSVSGFPVTDIAATAKGRLSALDATVAGSGGATGSERIDAAARLNLAAPPRSAYVSRLSASYQGIPIAIVSPVVLEEIPPGGWRVRDLDARVEDGEIKGSAEYTAAGIRSDLAIRNIPMRLAGLAGVDIIRSGRLFGTLDVDTRGTVSGRFDLTAATLRLDGAQIDDPFNVTVTGTMDGRNADILAEMRSAMIVEPLRARARIPLVPSLGSPLPLPDRNAPFSAEVDWSGDIAEIWSFVPAPDHVLSGPVLINGRASGTLNAPVLSGGAALEGGQYSNLEFGTLITNLNANAAFNTDGRVTFDLSGNDGVEGRITGTGSYLVADGTIDAQLDLTNAALVRRDDLTAVISGSATAKSRGNVIAVDGGFRTDYVELRLIGGFGSKLVTIDVIPVGATAPLYEPPDASGGAGQRIALNVALDFPTRVFVRGRGLDSEWGGRLDVTGFASNPKINGAIERRRGWLDLLGRQFELTIGEVRFSGSTDPYVRVRLAREANGIEGWLDVEGYSSDLEIGFGSIPSLPDEEVLPRLLFGRSKQSLTALEAAQLAAGVATLLSGKAGVLDTVRGTLGVDVLRVESGDDGSTSVVTGKYVNENVFVGAKQNLTTSETSGLVEIEVFDNYEIEAELGSTEAKGSVNWSIDY